MEEWGREIWERKSKEQDGFGVSGGIVSKIRGKKNYLESKKKIQDIILNKFKIKNKSIKKVLEIGPGSDALNMKFLKHKFNLDVLDVSKNTISLLKNKFPVKGMNFYEQDIVEMKINKKYDLIFCLGTLLHIPSHLVLIAMNNFNKHLEKKGYLILDFAIKEPMNLKKGLWEGIYFTGHRLKKRIGKQVYPTTISSYTPREIKDILRRSNFKEISNVGGLWLLQKTE